MNGDSPLCVQSFAQSTESVKVKTLVFGGSLFARVYNYLDKYVDAEQIFNALNNVLVKLYDTKCDSTFGEISNSCILITALLCLFRRFKKEGSVEQRVKQFDCLK